MQWGIDNIIKSFIPFYEHPHDPIVIIVTQTMVSIRYIITKYERQTLTIDVERQNMKTATDKIDQDGSIISNTSSYPVLCECDI